MPPLDRQSGFGQHLNDGVVNVIIHCFISFSYISAVEDSEQDLEAGPPLVFVRSVRGECAGILITENIIIASARCAYNNNSTVVIITKQNIRHVTFDGYNRQNELQLSHVITHPNYNETLGTHDIALLKLEKPIHVQNNVIPSCLWLEDETIPPKPMIAEWRNWKARRLTRKELKKIADSSNCIRYLQPMPPTYRKYDIADYHLCVLAKVNHLHVSKLSKEVSIGRLTI
uniref:Peptidase S1 domain-containing protein n=1 Tax=Anopheles funestus TaxID=62324 RepID=A0A182REI2_ANOFN